MQTFLPYPDFRRSAQTLDRQRLGKQRVEAWQILRALAGETMGWRRHPAVLMWSGHEDSLREYGRAVCREWIARGYRDAMLERFAGPDDAPAPSWLGDERLHRSHRRSLYRKDPKAYAAFVDDALEEGDYYWPARSAEALS